TLTPCRLKNPPSTPMTIAEPTAACATGKATLKVGTDPPDDCALPDPLDDCALPDADALLLEEEPQPTHASAASRVAITAVGLTISRDIARFSSLLAWHLTQVQKR